MWIYMDFQKIKQKIAKKSKKRKKLAQKIKVSKIYKKLKISYLRNHFQIFNNSYLLKVLKIKRLIIIIKLKAPPSFIIISYHIGFLSS